MSDKKPNPRKPGYKQPNCPSPEFAKKVWFQNHKPSFRKLEELLAAQGLEVDNSTLVRWANDDPEWQAAVLEAKAKVPPTKIIAAIKAAKEDAKNLAPEVIIGVKAQLVARLYETIKEMQITTVDDWLKALDCCERIEALIHAERGKAIADNDRLAVPRGVAPSLISRLNPSVAVAPFKKPVATAGGGNGSNGGGH